MSQAESIPRVCSHQFTSCSTPVLTWSLEKTRIFAGFRSIRPRSGRGGRRFKSSLSDQHFLHFLNSIPGEPRVRREYWRFGAALPGGRP